MEILATSVPIVEPTASATTIRSQVRYVESPAGLATARAIVAAKLRCSRLLLDSYRRERSRSGSPQAVLLRTVQYRLHRIHQLVPQTPHRATLFLLEAQAARQYWQSIGMLCHRDVGWRRAYPHATDQVNIVLNTGYTALCRRAVGALIAAGVAPQLGVLHGDSAGHGALGYDLAEIFRAAAVDAVVLPLFSRRRYLAHLDERRLRRGMYLIHARWQERFLYLGRLEQLQTILEREAIALRRAIIAGVPWNPYHHHFGHRRRHKEKPTAGFGSRYN